MDRFVVEGGHRLSGKVRPSGSKNEALPVIAATVLCAQPVVLHNVPHIADVLVMLDILAVMGAKVDWTGPNTVTIDCGSLCSWKLPPELCDKLRASILLAGPLLARFGKVVLPPPGGDVIGRRRLDTHFLGLAALGAKIHIDEIFQIDVAELKGADIFLDEPSVTGTENVLMAAVRARGQTTIRNAACEPHIQGLCRMLNAMGAHIQGIGTNALVIEGVDALTGTEHRVGPDYLEIGSLVGLAAVTGSEFTIEDCVAEDLRMIQIVFEKLGVGFEQHKGHIKVPAGQALTIQSDFLGHIPQIADAPWPMFPTDMMSIAITIATQAAGTVLFFEKMFDGRMFFTDSLVSMGAKIILCDPHRVVVTGPSRLMGTTIQSPDVRAGMAMLIAALCAQGKSTIYNVRQIDRGYERIDEKLCALGARIERQSV